MQLVNVFNNIKAWIRYKKYNVHVHDFKHFIILLFMKKNYVYPSKHWTHKLSWSQTFSRVFIPSIAWSIFDMAWKSSTHYRFPLSFSSYSNIDILSNIKSFIRTSIHWNYFHLSYEYVCLAGLPVACYSLVCAIKGICNQCFFHTSFEFRW